MQQRFHLFVRRHHQGWCAASILTHPGYAAVGRDLNRVRDEIRDTLARDLALEILPRQEVFFEDLQTEELSIDLSAVQHDRLVSVPMTFTLAVHPSGDDRFTVWVPRLQLSFTLKGRKYLRGWTIERIRHSLHLKDVRHLLALGRGRREQIEPLEVRWHGSGRYRKELRGTRLATAAKAALQSSPALGGVGVDLVEEARQGRLSRALDRRDEVDRLAQALAGRRHRAALLLGESGVGKTALVHELCHRIAAGTVPRRLQGAKVWFVSGTRLMAGMRYLGQWQQRALTIARGVASAASILYVGDLVELLQAGTGRGGLNAGQVFLPFLDRDAFPFIAEATGDSLARAEQLHGPFVRALRRVEVQGMGRDRAFGVLEVLARRAAKGTGTTVTDEALSSALEVLSRYGRADALPGSGVALLQGMVRSNPRTVLGAGHAIAAFAEATGFPAALIDPDVPLDVAATREHFRRRIVGQPGPAEVFTRLLLVLKAGLNDPDKPLGSVLLMGPTGVGKTESAKALAQWLFGASAAPDQRLVRFDMSEFGAIGSAQRLVDGPGGQGLLTRRIREQPFSVVLLDEIEKAEPGVYDVLLQVLGEGRLTDGTGQTVSFRHTIVLMTSNLGVSKGATLGLVPEADSDRQQRFLGAANAFFRPEFVNRLDAIVPFDPLSAESVRIIARGMLGAALAREGLSRRGVTVAWGDDVVDHVVRVGYHPKLGARPLARAIETEVLAPLARVVARGQGRALSLAVIDGRVGVSST